MTFPVKRAVAKPRKKRRNRRVKTEKVEAKLTEELKNRFTAACQKRGAVMSTIVRDLIIAWCESIESGRKPDAPFEIREKRAKK